MSDYDHFTRDWQFKPNIKAKLKGLFEFKSIKPWKGPLGKQEIIRFENYQGVSDFSRDFKSVFISISGKSTLKRFKFSLKWIPSAKYFLDSPFAMFLLKDTISLDIVEILKDTNLIHGYYGKYVILSSGHDFDIFSSSIDFFYRFRFLLPKSRSHRPLLLRDVTGRGGNKAFLLFSSIRGHGLLIKILDREYGGGINKELDIMRIGKIIGANIPKNAVVIHNTGSPMFKSLGKDNFFVQTLTPVIKHFREASQEDLEEIAEYDADNLGRIFIFDIVCGSWDRHSGNYLINKLKNKNSLQEIDFGLFQPDYYKPEKFKPDDETRQKYPSKNEKLLGWAITRHPKVDKIIKRTNKKKFILGVKSSLLRLHKVVEGKNPILENLIGKKLFSRVQGIFKKNSQTQLLLYKELSELGIDSDDIKTLIDKKEL
ncbi:MAG: hypothetical protein ACW981_21065 [Candidatus Hodarchaeales archaeon]